MINTTTSQTRSGHRWLWLAMALLICMAAIGIYTRPFTPIDETRYLGVAWEMWLRGDFLVPFKNGLPYSHKPPLLMWLVQSGWALFGVNDWWPRLVMPLASAASLGLLWSLARRLWPQRSQHVPGVAVLIMATCFMWIAFSTMLMFDMLVALFTLAGLHGILSLSEGKRGQGVVVLGAAIGLGVLAKGPVILLHLLPVALLAPWWNTGQRWGRWLLSLLLAVLLGAVVALAWALPAGFSGGEAYRNAIFWGQTANRMVESFAHRRPIWWYLPLLPVMLFPWFVWPGLWRALLRYLRQSLDRGGRFCLAWSLPVLIAFSFISGKQPHYLLPIFPAFALLAARALDDAPRVGGLWLPALLSLTIGAVLAFPARFGIHADPQQMLQWPALVLMAAAVLLWLAGRRLGQPLLPMALLSVAVTALVQLGVLLPRYDSYDMRPLGQAIAQSQASGQAVANMGQYHDQFQFAGRLQQPLAELVSLQELQQWLQAHPQGRVVLYVEKSEALQGIPTLITQRYRNSTAALVDARNANVLLARPGATDMLKW